MGSNFILFPESHPVGAGRDLRDDLVPCLCFYIAGEDSETQRGEETCLRTHWKVLEPRAFSGTSSGLYSISTRLLVLRRPKHFKVSWPDSKRRVCIQWKFSDQPHAHLIKILKAVFPVL